MTFYKRIILVYASIVIIPLSLLLIGISMHSFRVQVNKMEQIAIANITNDIQKIKKILDECDSIETIIKSDDKLNLFLINPWDFNEEEIIDTLKEKTTLFEQIQVTTPDIYNIRIFTTSDLVPERWPVIMHSSRLEKVPDYWDLNYVVDSNSNVPALNAETVCTTRSIFKNKRLVSYFQISILRENFFPSVFNNENPFFNEYIFKKDADTNTFVSYKAYEHLNSTPKLSEKENRRIQKKLQNMETPTGAIVFRPSYKVVAWSYIPEMDIYLVTENKDYELIKGFTINIIVNVLSILFLIVALYFVVKYVTQRLMNGIYSVMDGMKKVKEGDVSVQIPVSGVDEVAETQETFNSMTKQLSNQIEQIKTEQSLIADTEMKAMQNQINAHFLYNVLETIRMQAVLADQDDISESLQVLGKMMRYCLRWRIHRVSLAQEIEYIRSYVYILNIRNDYVISLEIDIPDEFMDIEIPKMTLQPLVENAFVHAIEKTESDAVLKVYAKLSEDGSRIILSVQDFGEGMSEEQVNKIKEYLANTAYERDSKGSIGLKNIQQRLTVFYGDDYKMEITSKLGEGTIISVPVPLKRMA